MLVLRLRKSRPFIDARPSQSCSGLSMCAFFPSWASNVGYHDNDVTGDVTGAPRSIVKPGIAPVFNRTKLSDGAIRN